jgi:predicted acyl esterase
VTNPADGFTDTLSRHGNVAASPYLPLDQSLEREAGLVWETPAVTEPLAVIGPIALDLVASSTAPDTDWDVRVSDVAPDGHAALLTEGYLRASHRALDAASSRPERPYHPHVDPTPIPTGAFLPYRIEVWPTADELQRGHRLRLQLTSDDTPNHTPGTVQIDKDDPSRFVIRPNLPALNTVRYGGEGGSSLLVPFARVDATNPDRLSPATLAAPAAPSRTTSGAGRGRALPSTGGSHAVVALLLLATAVGLRRRQRDLIEVCGADVANRRAIHTPRGR